MGSPHENIDGPHPLLARGSRILGLASVAAACGQRPGEGPWYVLSKETTRPAESILKAIASNGDTMVLESAVRAALSPEPATSLPPWTTAVNAPEALLRIAGAIEISTLRKLLPDPQDPHQLGLAALALAFCRSHDHLVSLSQFLNEDDRARFLRLGALAAVTVRPGEPSKMRLQIKQCFVGNQEVKNV